MKFGRILPLCVPVGRVRKSEKKGYNTLMKRQKTKGEIAWIAVMVTLTVLFLPVLIVNVVLIVKGSVEPDVPPSVFGIAPLAVTSGSMAGEAEDSFDTGALIFVKLLDEEEKNELQEGDVVTFRHQDIYVTHRIVLVEYDGAGQIRSVITQGDANNITDGAIPLENVVGQCVGHVAGLGGFAMFLQTPAGILVFVGVPVVAFIAIDILRIALYNRKVRREELAAGGEGDLERELRDKEEELARLRALVAEQGKDETEEQ